MEGARAYRLMRIEHLPLYRDLALLLVKYGRSDLVRRSGLSQELAIDRIEPTPPAAADAAQLADDLEKLGPTFVKLGQLLSTRPDILPPAYADALARLQDRCQPFAYEDVERIVTEETGVRMSKAFVEFDKTPVAAASISQVHRAVLRSGREVAVKVQRPEIRARVAGDLETLADIAAFIDASTEIGRAHRFGDLVEEFRKTLWRELDFREEASNLLRLSRNLERFERIVVPQPVMDFSTTRVLTMQFVNGRKVTKLGPLAKLEVDGDALADELFHAYLQQILADGFFHADPHPGNVFLTDDEHLALIDLGMVGRVAPAMQERLLELVLSITDRRSDDAARVMLTVGEVGENADPVKFRRELSHVIAQVEDARIKDIQFGRVVLEATRIAAANGIRPPPEFALIGKTLLNLDQIGRTLSPDFDPNASIRRHAGEVVEQRLASELSLVGMFQTAMELKSLTRQLPGRLNTVLERLANNEFSVKVDTIDETRLIEGLQKVANRITTGLVLAALIIGAAMLVRVPSPLEIIGYPALAILLFVAAAAGAIGLVAAIVATDVRARRRR